MRLRECVSAYLKDNITSSYQDVLQMKLLKFPSSHILSLENRKLTSPIFAVCGDHEHLTGATISSICCM